MRWSGDGALSNWRVL